MKGVDVDAARDCSDSSSSMSGKRDRIGRSIRIRYLVVVKVSQRGGTAPENVYSLNSTPCSSLTFSGASRQSNHSRDLGVYVHFLTFFSPVAGVDGAAAAAASLCFLFFSLGVPLTAGLAVMAASVAGAGGAAGALDGLGLLSVGG